MQGSPRAGLIAVSGIALTLAPASALAQEEPERCIVLCAPTLKLEPTLTIENLLQRHRVRDGATSETARAERSAELEMILALDIPTTIPRVSFTFEAIWAPFAAGSSSASSGAGGAAEESAIRENGVELEFELNLHVLPSTRTGGWLGAHFDIIDKYSSAERPGEGSEYTHKLNFELDVGVAPFNFLDRGWLRRLELETSLDYVATGLPRAGDVGRLGEEMYLDDASPWSLSFVLVLPIARRTDLPLRGEGRTYGKQATVPAGEWGTLRVVVTGDLFEVYHNDVKLFEVEDATFTGAGLVGVWTKADSVTYFDDLTVVVM